MCSSDLLIEKLGEIWALQPNLNAEVRDVNGMSEENEARLSGKKLNAAWNVGAAHPLYRKDGTWYHCLERYPGALFDEKGYILFPTEDDLHACPGITIKKEHNHLHVPSGIAALPGYKKKVE